MTTAEALRDIKIIDTDTHVVEPPDLWTSRVSKKWGDLVPHVKWDADAQEEFWYAGDLRLGSAGGPAMAGWHEYPPLHPRRFADAAPVASDPKARLKMMDDYGIHVALLYPNVAVFDAKSIVGMKNPELQVELFRAYNDYQTDFASYAPDRYLPVTGVPFWDMEATLKELERTAASGHRRMAFTQDPSFYGLPRLTDRYWDRMWASAQEKGMAVNFHIASAGLNFHDLGVPENGDRANYAMMGVNYFMANSKTLSQLTCGGICHRFPELNFVSVESGVGWVPYALEALDWQWKNCGCPEEHPDMMLPSDYFKRQIYACFWFERDSAIHAIEQIGADNILFETDYPHPTSMSPGPATTAIRPDDYLRQAFSGVDEVSMRKILHDNAAKLYHLD
jgi:predicted TIM-barrel fold metal-dependent hydrolase